VGVAKEKLIGEARDIKHFVFHHSFFSLSFFFLKKKKKNALSINLLNRESEAKLA
jgi:hypothetical protein